MPEIAYSAKSQNKRALYLFIGLLIGALAFAILYITVQLYRGVIGMVAMVLIIAAVFIYTKYVAVTYIYSAAELGETSMFTVRHKLGKRETTLCGVELRSIVSVKKLTAEERRSYKTDKEYVPYYYCPTMGADFVYVITYRSYTEKAEIFVEVSDEFAAELTKYVELARASYVEDEF